MTPYYQDESVTLYHADCRDVLPSLGRFDLLLTDPPYGMNFQSNYRNIKHAPIYGDDRLPVELITRCIEMSDNAAYVFCRWDNIYQMPKPKSVIAWIKNNWSMGDLLHEHGRQWEAVLFYDRPGHEFLKRIPDVIHADRTGNSLHPTEKPVNLLRTLISANVCTTVFDPFAGSCAAGLAAKDLGRKCVLIEREERYCEVGAKRLQQEAIQFDPPTKQSAETVDIFGGERNAGKVV